MRLIDADALKVDYLFPTTTTGTKCYQYVSMEQIQNAPTISPEPHWIPVTERLPEEDYEEGDGTQLSDYVLMTVTDTDGNESFVDIGSTQDGTWWSATRGHDIHDGWTVTAWMPLPDPWHGVQDD